MPGWLIAGLVLLAVSSGWIRWSKRHPRQRDDSDTFGIIVFAACGVALVVVQFTTTGIIA